MGQKGNKKKRVRKTLAQKVIDLDAHLYLLRTHLGNLRDSASHLKAIATELRTLVCHSSGTEGLLYRLIHELGVDDSINLHVPGDLDLNHPINEGLQFMTMQIYRGGQGPENIPPFDHSLRAVIRDAQALVADGKPLTHEYLIKAVAQQMGSAHEDEGLEPALSQLSGIFINGVQPFVDVLVMDAKLTLEMGERVLFEAERRGIFKRPFHGHDYGNVTIEILIAINQRLVLPLQLCQFHAYGPFVTIKCTVTEFCVVFLLTKKESTIVEMFAPYPDDVQMGDPMVFALSYCSRTNQARTITTRGASPLVTCQLGWVHATELEFEQNREGFEGHLFSCSRLLSLADVVGRQTPPHGLATIEELDTRGPFPA